MKKVKKRKIYCRAYNVEDPDTGVTRIGMVYREKGDNTEIQEDTIVVVKFSNKKTINEFYGNLNIDDTWKKKDGTLCTLN